LKKRKNNTFKIITNEDIYEKIENIEQKLDVCNLGININQTQINVAHERIEKIENFGKLFAGTIATGIVGLTLFFINKIK
jgi:uncharacterized protein YfkK (UPF0435 family)